MEPQKQSIPSIDAVKTLLDTGRLLASVAKENPLDRGVPYVVLRDSAGNERIEYLDPDALIFPTKKCTITLFDPQSIIAYWKRHSVANSTIYASLNPASFVGIIDDHGDGKEKEGATTDTEEDARWREHLAVYSPKHSVEWVEWSNKNGVAWDGNIAFAEWLEDHIPDFLNPSGGEMLEMALNFKVDAQRAYSNPTRLQSGHTELTFKNLVEGSSVVSGGKVTIPEEFTIAVPVFEGKDQPKYEVRARFRYRLGSGGLKIYYQLVRPHKVVEEAFLDIVSKIEAEAGGKVLYGNPG